MAHPGFRLLPFLLLAACGGVVVDGGTGTNTNHGTSYVDAWKSFTMRITSASRTWSDPAPPPTTGDPTAGWSGRVDFDPGAQPGDAAHVVILPQFADGTSVDGTSGATITFNAPSYERLLSVAAAAPGPPFGALQDDYDTLVVQLAQDGTPTGGTLSGRTEYSDGDVAFDGTVTATITFEPDHASPTWQWTGATPFAPVTLPWDVHTVAASEPYEEALGADAFVEGVAPTAMAFTSTPSAAHGTMKNRSATLTWIDWDLSGTAVGTSPTVHDFATNASVAAPPANVPGVTIARRDTGSWAPDDGGPPAFTWGPSHVVLSECDTCAPELALGPVNGGDCAPSGAGFATRLAASGPYMVRLRAHAAPPYSGAPYLGPPPGVSDVVHVEIVVPGKAPQNVDVSSMKWPESAASDGSYDTGFVDVWASPGGPSSETGVAVSAGGLGASSSCGYGGPTPATWNVTVWAEHIAPTPPP